MFPIQTKSLTKSYKLPDKKTRLAVDSLSIEVAEGTAFGFLGPNGAGKTTTIKMILNFLEPTSGEVRLFDLHASDPKSRKDIGYLPEQPYFPKFLKPIEVVSLHAQLSGFSGKQAEKLAMEAIELAGISEYTKTPISKLSKGLTQRVGIAQALVSRPKLLILDEPTSGLDPIGRRHTRDLLAHLKSEGVTIFLSSHVLSEIEDICDTVAIMKRGSLVACGPPQSIRSGTPMIEIILDGLTDEHKNRLSFMKTEIITAGNQSIINVAPDSLYEITRALEEMGLQANEINTRHESLEEAFLRLAA
jgi:ABC-2 type transport system ATP-binding protein